MSHHLVGMAEIAAMLGVSRQRVSQLPAVYPDFPAPEVDLAGGRVWSRTAIETWIASHPERGLRGGEPADAATAPPDVFARFTDLTRRVVIKAMEEARLLGHPFIGTEHLLLGILSASEGVARSALAAMDVTIDAARELARELVPQTGGQPAGHIPFTPRAADALRRAVDEADLAGAELAGPEHLLLAIMADEQGVAVKILGKAGVAPADVRTSVADASSRVVAPARARHGRKGPRAPDGYLACSFCSKHQRDVSKLIAGPGVFICDECVRLCVEICGEEGVEVLRTTPRAIVVETGTGLEARVERVEQRLARLERGLGDQPPAG